MSKQITAIGKNKEATGCCCASKNQRHAEAVEKTTQNSDLPRHLLAVNGATCGGCVGKIERALQSVYGVESARMNLITGVATVSGGVAIELLISALEKAGFSATTVEKSEIED